jgi:hypothetical protein
VENGFPNQGGDSIVRLTSNCELQTSNFCLPSDFCPLPFDLGESLIHTLAIRRKFGENGVRNPDSTRISPGCPAA